MKKLIISSGVLFNSVANLIKIIDAKAALPILEKIVFRCDGNTLKLTAGNFENQVTTQVDFIESEELHFAMEGKILLNSLKELAEQPLTFQVDTDKWNCTIIYNNGKFNLPVVDDAEFPIAPKVESNTVYTISADNFRYIIRKCAAFVGGDELRPVLGSIEFKFDKNLQCAASNGHHLVKIEMDCDIPAPGSFLLSAPSAKMAESFLGKATEDVTIIFNQSNAILTLGTYVFTLRNVEGKYPNVNSVIPTNYTDYCEVERKDFTSVIRRIMVFGNTTSGLVKFRLDGMNLEVAAKDIDYSTSAEETLICNHTGKDITAGLKSTELLSIMNTLDSPNIRIKFSDASRAFVFEETENREGSNILFILMPMMLND